jgi:stage II sporulation protein D
MIRAAIIIFSCFFSLLVQGGALMRVRIYAATTVSSFSVTLAGSNYHVWCGDSLHQFNVKPGTLLSASYLDDSVQLKKGDSLVGKFCMVRISEIFKEQRDGGFTIKLDKPDKPARVYDDGLEISVSDKFLRILNLVDIEHYTAGVIQSEVGKMNPVEFNKVKAEIIRTYSLSNLRRHEPENYNLCDQTHCQVYRGKSYVPGILKAVKETEGLVLVDTGIALVNASFFSNCGGQTCNSEDVWTKPLSYLRSVKDTFCGKQPSAYWEKKISKKEWLEYFSSKYDIDIKDTLISSRLLSNPEPYRRNYFISSPKAVLYKVLREDWKLRSAFFSVDVSGEFVVLKGRGFGHGVGLCQEGAMRMAKLGYTAQQIIGFYYQDVTLIDLSKLEFFKEE